MDEIFLGPLIAFVVASTITPGPNSIMIMASGVNFGFRRTLPHVLGVAVGITLVITLAGVGVGELLQAIPQLQTILFYASVAYLLYLAWKIANAAPTTANASVGKPFTFFQAATFQWVNPKVWALGMAAVSIFAPQFHVFNVLVVALGFALVGIFSNTSWAWAGTFIMRFLSTGRRLRIFNVAAACLLVASLYPIFL